MLGVYSSKNRSARCVVADRRRRIKLGLKVVWVFEAVCLVRRCQRTHSVSAISGDSLLFYSLLLPINLTCLFLPAMSTVALSLLMAVAAAPRGVAAGFFANPPLASLSYPQPSDLVSFVIFKHCSSCLLVTFSSSPTKFTLLVLPRILLVEATTVTTSVIRLPRAPTLSVRLPSSMTFRVCSTT